jgi:TPR repeat protein
LIGLLINCIERPMKLKIPCGPELWSMPKPLIARWIGRVAGVSFVTFGIAFGWQASLGLDRMLGSPGVLEQGDLGRRQGELLFLKAALDRLDADVNRTDPDSPALRSLRAEQDAVVLRMREVASPLSAESLPSEPRSLVEHEPRAASESVLAAVPDIVTGGAAVPVELKVGLAAVSRDPAQPRDPPPSRAILIVPPRPVGSNAASSSNEGFISPAQTDVPRAAAEIAAVSDVPEQLEPIAEAPQPSRDRQLVNATELRAQLAQATEQLKASQDRISQLEGQLKQAPSAADLDKAGKQGDELRAQLTQATEQLKASQGRISQLEGQLKQAPSAADLDKAGKQGAELRVQLTQATEQLKASQGRIAQLEGQLKQAPSAADLDDARKEIGDLRSQLSAAKVIVEGRKSQIDAAKSTPPSGTRATAVVARANDETNADVSILLNRGDALFGAGDLASARLFYQRAAEAGNGQAALRLGNTYDPAFLERAQLRVQGDRALALFWYQRARELGAGDAEILLKGAQTQSER